MIMDNVKGLVFTKTFWGVVITLVGLVLPKIRTLDPEAAASVAEQVMQAVGAVIALIGRITAKAQVVGFISPGPEQK
jgi:hypothetical protein